jgi:hypothetical protein
MVPSFASNGAPRNANLQPGRFVINPSASRHDRSAKHLFSAKGALSF